jgi:hypothetical protein
MLRKTTNLRVSNAVPRLKPGEVRKSLVLNFSIHFSLLIGLRVQFQMRKLHRAVRCDRFDRLQTVRTDMVVANLKIG